MKKFEAVQEMLTQDTHNGIQEMRSRAHAGQWNMVRDISLQIVVGTAILQNMEVLTKQKKIAKQERRDRKAEKRAARASSN